MALTCCSFAAFSQQTPNFLSLRVNELKASNRAFVPVSLFNPAGDARSDSHFGELLAEGQLLSLDKNGLRSLYESKQEFIEFNLPIGNGNTLALELYSHQLLTEDFSVVTSESNGQAIDYQPGVYYRGIVKGDPASLAAISIFEDEIIGVISLDRVGNMVIGKTGEDARTASYIFYKEDDMLFDHGFSCDTEDIPVDPHGQHDEAGGERVAKCVRAYLECEYQLVTEKGGATGAVNFMTGLFNVVAALYQNEAITTYVSQIFTWTTPDPYATSSTSAALTSFRNYRTTYNGDVAHLVSRGAPTGGGIAWVDALCTSYAYAYSYINSTYQQLPAYSWSVNVLTHEMGHNLGSPHTHACAWNGNNTAIDGCGPAAGANEGCSGPLPSSGTIMSYCHLISGVGINFANGFGPQPGDKIRSEVSNAACLAVCSNPCVNLSTGGNHVSCNGGNNGTATVTASGGTAPYTYAWSNGSTAQTISNLAAGSYTVTVTTATGCTGTASRVVTQPSAIAVSMSIAHATGGSNNGSISLSVSGGTPGYTYFWSNGKTTQNISGLAPGTYTVTVTDTKGCTKTAAGQVQNGGSTPMNLSFSVTNTTNGASNGAIDLTVTGGTAPYTYTWSNGATTQDLLNIPAGTYSVTVKDATNATKTGSATVANSSGGCASLPHANSFENGLGGWVQATNDQMDWTLLSGSTPSPATGPDFAANGSFYAYTEATNNTNRNAFLESPCLNVAGVASFQVSFAYHMYGSQMGTLRLQYSINGGSTWYTAWTKSGNQGNSWKTQSITFTNNGVSSLKLRFFGRTGGDKSDMAIDNVNIISSGNLVAGDVMQRANGEVWVDLGSEIEKIALHPNPVSEDLSIVFNAGPSQTSLIVVSDQMGREALQQTVETVEGQNNVTLDVRQLQAGIYFLTIADGEKRQIERFVVIK
jgi:hypothetical protein